MSPCRPAAMGGFEGTLLDRVRLCYGTPGRRRSAGRTASALSPPAPPCSRFSQRPLPRQAAPNTSRAGPSRPWSSRAWPPARGLCFLGYAVLHSGTTRTPLWSAEHLTSERVEAAHEPVRPGKAASARRCGPSCPTTRAPATTAVRWRHPGTGRTKTARPRASPWPTWCHRVAIRPKGRCRGAHRLNTGLWSAIEGAVRGLARRDGEV